MVKSHFWIKGQSDHRSQLVLPSNLTLSRESFFLSRESKSTKRHRSCLGNETFCDRSTRNVERIPYLSDFNENWLRQKKALCTGVGDSCSDIFGLVHRKAFEQSPQEISDLSFTAIVINKYSSIIKSMPRTHSFAFCYVLHASASSYQQGIAFLELEVISSEMSQTKPIHSKFLFIQKLESCCNGRCNLNWNVFVSGKEEVKDNHTPKITHLHALTKRTEWRAKKEG